MKIILFARKLSVGGAERQLVELATSLYRRGHEVMVLTQYPGGVLEGHLIEAGVPLGSLYRLGRFGVMGMLLRLVKVLRNERPDVVHSYLDGDNVLLALIEPFIDAKIVWGMRSIERDMSGYNIFGLTMNRLQRLLAGRADLIISNSRIGRRQALAKGFPKSRVVSIPNGIDVNKFRIDETKRGTGRQRWGLGQDQLVVGHVGRLHPIKDHHTLLESAQRVIDEIPDVVFLIAGAGDPMYEADIRRYAQDLGISGSVRWIGAQSDVASFYNAIDILVSSSRAEGFPNVIGEAMACGVPCIVTDVGDSAYVVGDTGTVVPVASPARLAESIANVLGARRAAHYDPSRTRDRIVKHFAIESLVKRTEDHFSDLLKSSESPSA